MEKKRLNMMIGRLVSLLIAICVVFYVVVNFYQILPQWPMWLQFPVWLIVIGTLTWLTAPFRFFNLIKETFRPILVRWIESTVIMVDVSKGMFMNDFSSKAVEAIIEGPTGVRDPFLRDALIGVIQGHDPQSISETLQTKIQFYDGIVELNSKDVKRLAAHFLAMGIFLSGCLLIAGKGHFWTEAGLILFSALASMGVFLFFVSHYFNDARGKAMEMKGIMKGIMLMTKKTEPAFLEYVLLHCMPQPLKSRYEELKQIHYKPNLP